MNQIENIKEKINQIILENMPGISVKELTDNVELFSLGLNSLNAVSLVLGLEEIFGFEFDMNEISYESFRTIADIVGLVRNKLDVTF
ncbi:acyl carrier protein [Xenococcus sp. PCC 7305]|uniref:acyl carrier protein n=1 Tax=Xenococcus sp. PCC 7305 TaxID=102125 RepID=UPI0002AC2452|nr:phosphopantetheine-binding protein [Xenococcus sp. PCC 7305]ELS02522.1 acyl carrier protein [Xenococcus sp. PCC 7305]